jgi:hypothetical protein
MKKLGLLSIATSLLLTAVPAQADLVPENFLPENTLALLSVRNAQRDHFAFMGSPMGLLLKDPAMQPFTDYVASMLREPVEKIKNALEEKEISLSKYKDLLGGGFAVALLATVSDPCNTSVSQVFSHKDVGIDCQPLVLIEINANLQTAQASLDELKSKIPELADQKPTFRTQKFGELEFTTMEIPDHGDPAEVWFGLIPQSSDSLCLAVTLFRSGLPGDIEKTKTLLTALAMNNRKAPLSESVSFRQQTTITPERNYFFLNGSLLIDGVKKIVMKYDSEYKAPENMMETMLAPGRPMAIFDALGVEAFKSYTLTWWTEPNGDFWAEQSLVCPEAERKGLSGILNGLRTADCSPLPQAPAESMSFSRIQLDFPALVSNFDIAATRIAGGMKSMVVGTVNAFLAMDPEINVQKNVMDNLTGEVVVWKNPLKLAENNQPYGEQVILLGAKDPQACGSTLHSIFRLIYKGKEVPTLEEKEASGLRYYSLPMNESSNRENSSDGTIDGAMGSHFRAQMPDLNFALLDGYILIATHENAIKRLVSTLPADSLASRGGIASAAEKVGGSHASVFNYVDDAASLEALQIVWQTVIAPNLLNSPDAPPELLKGLELFPDISQIRKYWGISVSALEVTPEGARMKSCRPWPKELTPAPDKR